MFNIDNTSMQVSVRMSKQDVDIYHALRKVRIDVDGLHKEERELKIQRCIAHPLKKKPMIINNKALAYAAAMNVSLVYYKLLDDVVKTNHIRFYVSIRIVY